LELIIIIGHEEDLFDDENSENNSSTASLSGENNQHSSSNEENDTMNHERVLMDERLVESPTISSSSNHDQFESNIDETPQDSVSNRRRGSSDALQLHMKNIKLECNSNDLDEEKIDSKSSSHGCQSGRRGLLRKEESNLRNHSRKVRYPKSARRDDSGNESCQLKSEEKVEESDNSKKPQGTKPHLRFLARAEVQKKHRRRDSENLSKRNLLTNSSIDVGDRIKMFDINPQEEEEEEKENFESPADRNYTIKKYSSVCIKRSNSLPVSEDSQSNKESEDDLSEPPLLTRLPPQRRYSSVIIHPHKRESSKRNDITAFTTTNNQDDSLNISEDQFSWYEEKKFRVMKRKLKVRCEELNALKMDLFSRFEALRVACSFSSQKTSRMVLNKIHQVGEDIKCISHPRKLDSHRLELIIESIDSQQEIECRLDQMKREYDLIENKIFPKIHYIESHA